MTLFRNRVKIITIYKRINRKGGVSMNEVKTPKKPLIFYYVMVFSAVDAVEFYGDSVDGRASGQGSGLWNVYDHDGR